MRKNVENSELTENSKKRDNPPEESLRSSNSDAIEVK